MALARARVGFRAALFAQLRLLRLKTAVVLTLEGALLGAALTLVGCSGGSEEEGRIRVTPAQVVGGYQLKLDKGTERLELKADGTYVQDTVSQTRPVHRTGQWHIQNHFFDGSQMILLDAAIVPPATPFLVLEHGAYHQPFTLRPRPVPSEITCIHG